MKPHLRRSDLLYPELSYKVSGILFDVFKEIGFGYPEKYYQRAIAVAFAKNNVRFKEQISMPLIYDGKSIGRYQLDFLVEDIMFWKLRKVSILKSKILIRLWDI